MRSSLKCCTLSHLSIHPSRSSDFLETGKMQKLLIKWKHSAGQLNKQIWGLKVKVQGHKESGNENNLVFCTYHRRKWIDLHQMRTKVINVPFYTYCRIHFCQQKCFFVIICNYPWALALHVAAATWLCRLLVKCGIAECGMRKVKCGIQKCGKVCGMVGKMWNAERTVCKVDHRS